MDMRSFFRKPLGLFTAIVAIGLIVIVAAMSAFGGTSSTAAGPPRAPTPLTRAQFKHAELHMCLDFRSRFGWFVKRKKPTTLREVETWSRRLTSMTDRLTTQVKGLTPPPSAAASYNRFRRGVSTLDRDVDRLNHLAQTHQWRQLLLLVRSRWWKKVFGTSAKIEPVRCRPVSRFFT
jgi:hypothetical protein